MGHRLQPGHERQSDLGSQPSASDAEVRFFQGLSDGTRLQMLKLLLDHGEQSVSGFETSLGLPRTRVSLHLACLKSCGYVAARREGRFVYYRLADERVRQILRLARSVSDEHCVALAACPTIEGRRQVEHSNAASEPATIPLMEADGTCCCQEDARDNGVSAEANLAFGPWLHRRLVGRGLTPAELATALGVSTSAVRRWLLRGGYPSPELRSRLAEVLGVSAEEVRKRVRAFPSPALSPFAAWLDVEIHARDWTRAELARRLGLAQHSVTAWFSRGLRPRRSTRLRLANVLHIAVGQIPGN